MATSPLWSFEHPGDWSSPASRFLDASHVSDGQASLAVEASGWTSITSRSFSTTEIPQATNRLGVDVLVPSPEVNPWWTGEIRIHATCPAAGIHNEFLGNKPLSHLFLGEFNHVTFDLPPAAGAAFSAPGTCQLEIILNVVNDAGAFRLDRLGFE